MDNFRTVVSPISSEDKIGISDRILTIGSCFAETIGGRLREHKLTAWSNPFGTLYNPHSIHKVLQYALKEAFPSESTFLESQDVFLNYDFHSSVSALDPSVLKSKIHHLLTELRNQLATAKWVFITYGTASVFTKRDTGEIVANCHKKESSIFSKSMLSPAEILDSFSALYSLMMSLNPGIKVVLTVSPVRHVRDTLELNSVSKSILRTACYMIRQRHNQVKYFPAFEIMMDDLRDYRFYKSDLIHPNDMAEEYIWQAFATAHFDNELKLFLPRWKEIIQALHHRPFHPGTRAHLNFMENTLTKLKALPLAIDTHKEIEILSKQINDTQANLKMI